MADDRRMGHAPARIVLATPATGTARVTVSGTWTGPAAALSLMFAPDQLFTFHQAPQP
jgi:hypothetical protein